MQINENLSPQSALVAFSPAKEITPVTTRRSLLGGVVVSAIAGAAAVNAVAISAKKPKVEPIKYVDDPVLKAATECLNAMAERHGAGFKAHIDHETGFILIRPTNLGGAA